MSMSPSSKHLRHLVTTLLTLVLATSTAACTKPQTGSGSGSAATGPAAGAHGKARSATKPEAATPAKGPAASKPTAPTPPRNDLPPPIVGAIPPLKIPALAKGPAPALVAQLRQAHYDPERLGLREVRFKLTYLEKLTETRATAEGSWKSGGPPQLSLSGLWRKGAAVAKDNKRRENMHTALTFRLRRLLDGLGNGFLSRRLFDWRQREGKVEVLGDGGRRLTYQVANEFSKETVVVEIDAQARIRSVERRSQRGVNRKMSYTYKMVDGRNLVQSGTVSITFADNAEIRGKLRKKLSTMQGMSYQFTFTKVGRFWLPTQIYRRSPALAREISLALTYEAAKP